jgi:putative acetyltransferase
MITLALENPDQTAVLALLAASDVYMAALYPAESNHLLDVTALQKSNVSFVVARLDGEVVGCGAVVRSPEHWAEVKRMFVSPAARGRKLGRLLLEKLATVAQAGGATVLRLETGIKQPEALGLYRSMGFVEIEPFGDYVPDPLSLFMEKRLGAEHATAVTGQS